MGKCDPALDDDETRLGIQRVLSNIIRHAYSFADVEYQQRVWIDGKGPEVDSYSESLCGLFDDSNVVEFANGEALKFGYSDEMVKRLRSFAKTLRAFQTQLRESKGSNWAAETLDSEILARPGWETVRQSAAAFLDSAIEWFEVHGNDTPEFEWSWCGKTFGQPASDPR